MSSFSWLCDPQTKDDPTLSFTLTWAQWAELPRGSFVTDLASGEWCPRSIPVFQTGTEGDEAKQEMSLHQGFQNGCFKQRRTGKKKQVTKDLWSVVSLLNLSWPPVCVLESLCSSPSTWERVRRLFCCSQRCLFYLIQKFFPCPAAVLPASQSRHTALGWHYLFIL